ncbi:MAG: bifunctional riboflavin kinase/FMN adenylyltransferase [Kineosporiaceae bacterium]
MALCDLDERLRLIEEAGVDAVLVLPFTPALASWSPEEFVDRVLVAALGAARVVAGRDMRFGHRNAGTLQTLQDLGASRGFHVEVVPDTGIAGPIASAEGDKPRWSSSWVRTLVAEGDVERAAQVLGRPHHLVGPVVHGDHRGRELGYPTANLGLPDEGRAVAVPADGVYAGWLTRPQLAPEDPDRRLPAAISIGTNPTFEGTQRRVESYVLDRDDLDLYGQTVVVEFVRRLRPTVRFDGVEALLVQMADDVRRCREILAAD